MSREALCQIPNNLRNLLFVYFLLSIRLINYKQSRSRFGKSFFMLNFSVSSLLKSMGFPQIQKAAFVLNPGNLTCEINFIKRIILDFFLTALCGL